MAYLSYGFRRRHQYPALPIYNLYWDYCHRVCISSTYSATSIVSQSNSIPRFQPINGIHPQASMCANNYNFAILSPPQQLLVYRRRTLSYRIFVASSRYQRILDCYRWILSYRIFTVSSRHWQILNYRQQILSFLILTTSSKHRQILTTIDISFHRIKMSTCKSIDLYNMWLHIGIFKKNYSIFLTRKNTFQLQLHSKDTTVENNSETTWLRPPFLIITLPKRPVENRNSPPPSSDFWWTRNR